jgi:hypothetical protein
MMMLVKLATARQQIEKIAASPIMESGSHAGFAAKARRLGAGMRGHWAASRASGARSRA